MFLNLKKSVDVAEELGLNSLDELFLIQVLFQRSNTSFTALDKFFRKIKKEVFSTTTIESFLRAGILQEEPLRHWIKNKNSTVEIVDLYLTQEFYERFFILTDYAGRELFEAYPKTAIIQNATIILQKGEKIGNIYYDRDKLMQLYGEKIGNDLELHKEVLAKVKANFNDINFTIRSFIFDELWLSLSLKENKKDYTNANLV